MAGGGLGDEVSAWAGEIADHDASQGALGDLGAVRPQAAPIGAEATGAGGASKGEGGDDGIVTSHKYSLLLRG